MHHVRIIEAAHDVQDGVGLANVGQELIAEALASVRARHQPRDVVEGDRVRDRLRCLDDPCHGVEPWWRLQHQRLVEVVRVGRLLTEEPPLDGRQWQSAANRLLSCAGLLLRVHFDQGRKLGDGRVFKQLRRGQSQPRLVEFGDRLRDVVQRPGARGEAVAGTLVVRRDRDDPGPPA